VAHQYLGKNFTTSTWPDSIGNADMSINGVSASTLNGDRAASSDGVDDFGLADGPQQTITQNTYGIAFVVNSSDTTDLTNFMATNGSGGAFNLSDSDFDDGSNGELKLKMDDNNGNDIDVESTQVICDGNTHLICVNKRGDSGSQIEFYIDDMQNAATTTVHNNDPGFDSQNKNIGADMGFFCVNSQGNQGNFKALDMPFIEFKESPYSSTERQNLKQRVPGL
jgi:hypothetical protein